MAGTLVTLTGRPHMRVLLEILLTPMLLRPVVIATMRLMSITKKAFM